MPSKEHIKEMQELYKKKGGGDMSHEEAIDACNNLANFFEILTKVDQREKITEYSKRMSK